MKGETETGWVDTRSMSLVRVIETGTQRGQGMKVMS